MKWLGDGVMVYFATRIRCSGGPQLVEGVSLFAGLRIHSRWSARRTVLFQQRDYYGRTVDLASRIAEYVGPGGGPRHPGGRGCLSGVDVTFTDIGPVELKGVSRVRLHAAHREEAR